jgi:hypothetical protein
MQTAARPGWFARNWLWFVPAGCLTLLALGLAFILGIVYLAGSMMRSSEPYRLALAQASAHPAVIDAIGTPFEEGWMPTGSVNVSGPGGTANLAIDLSGPRGSGTLYAVAQRNAGQWQFSQLVFGVEGSGQRLNLLDAGAPAPEIPAYGGDSDWD